jgi:hypothetical protein
LDTGPDVRSYTYVREAQSCVICGCMMLYERCK